MASLVEKQIIAVGKKIHRPARIGFIETPHAHSAAIRLFAEQLQKLVSEIRISTEQGGNHELPALVIGRSLRYQGVPEGKELAPFLEALLMLNSEQTSVNGETYNSLSDMQLPAHLNVFVTPQCPFCPQVVRQMLPLVHANEQIQVTITDVKRFPETLQQNEVKAVPTVILDEQFRWTGKFKMGELVDVLTNRHPSALGVTSLETLLKEGRASQLAHMMLTENMIFEPFHDLLTHDKWPLRLGAMVAMEVMMAENPELCLGVLNNLKKKFDRLSNPVKGDMLYIFGQSGRKNLLPFIAEVMGGDFDMEVKEAAKEAYEQIESSSSQGIKNG
jgi:glutaredoxin